MGAAVHDIGKVAHPRELVQPGHAHECAGEALLLQHNIPERWARFGRTHARWEDELEPRLEDMLVAAADTWWRGRREQRLEAALGGRIAAQTGEAEWQVYSTLDDIASALTADADRRLAWQSQHAV